MLTTATGNERIVERKFSFDELEEILLYFSTSIIEKNTEEGILWDLVKNCIAKLKLVDCVIYFVDPRKKILIQKAAYGPKSPAQQTIIKPITIPLGKGITGTVALTGKAEIIRDTSKDSRYIVDDEMRLSEITVPIVTAGKVIGVIDCEHPLPNYFTDQHLKILSAIAALLAVRLSWIRAEIKVQQKQQRLYKARQEAADLKIRALRAQMNPHFVFNAINSIQHFITTNDKRSALNYLSLFSKLLRFYLQYLEEETIRISDEIKILTWYLTLQKLRYEGKFDFRIDPINMSSDIRIPALITQLCLEEQVENLMIANTGRSSLSMRFDLQDDKVLVNLLVITETTEKTKRGKTYRKDLPQWTDHLKLFNRIKKYNIKTKQRIKSNTKVSGKVESFELTLPIIE